MHLSLSAFFRNIPLFELLDGEEMAEMMRAVKPFVREAGDALFQEGDPSDGVYIIERGEVVVIARRAGGERVTLAELGNGAVIGELSLIDGSARSATVEAIAMSSGYWLSRSKFHEMRESGSHAAYKVILQLARTLEERKRGTEERLRHLIDSPDRSEQVRSKPVRELFGVLRKA